MTKEKNMQDYKELIEKAQKEYASKNYEEAIKIYKLVQVMYGETLDSVKKGSLYIYLANAYYACLGEEDGIVCIMGTGAVAYGVKNGISHRCSGYGYQEGDPGSSYDLGRHALKYYAKVVDKRLPKTSLFTHPITPEQSIQKIVR